MSLSRDCDDTASLPVCVPDPADHLPPQTDATDRMSIETAGSERDGSNGGALPYAEGIVRFYRARTILEGRLNGSRWQRAWRYLERLSPHDLPPESRRPFFELTHLVQVQANCEAFDSEDFSSRVRTIAGVLDEYVEATSGRYSPGGDAVS